MDEDREREVKLCLLGDAGVGKTCLVLRFVSNVFNTNSESTVGASFMTKTVVVDDRQYKYHIWDTAGQERYRGLAPMYYRGAGAAVLVFDITNRQSFKTLQSWISELQQIGPADIILAIAGNKCDKEDEREVSYEEAQQYAEEAGAIFAETSALDATNVSELFISIIKKLPKEVKKAPVTTQLNPPISLSPSTPMAHPPPKKRCC